DLDLVLLDARDPWGGERLLPLGRLREPRRALQRAGVVVVTRLAANDDPDAVARTAAEAGLEVVGLSAYRDHHWFRADEVARERRLAERERAALLLTAKDAVRWPSGPAAVPEGVL